MSLLEKIKKKLKGRPAKEPQEDTQQPYTDEEEEKVKDRLRDLGYTD